MMADKPDAFLSYTRFDDRNGKVSEFRTCLSDAVEEVSGYAFEIFQDIDGIGLGEKWQGVLDEMLDQARFFIPILTPKFFTSDACRDELIKFLELERKAGRQDLVLPVYWITCPVLEEDHLKAEDDLAQAINERQSWDWRDLRIEEFKAKDVQLGLSRLASQIDRARRNVLRESEMKQQHMRAAESLSTFEKAKPNFDHKRSFVVPFEDLGVESEESKHEFSPKINKSDAELRIDHRLSRLKSIGEGRFLDETLINNMEYQLFLDEQHSQGLIYYPDHWIRERFSNGEELKPVLGVRFEDAVSFCEWLTIRFPEKNIQYKLPTREDALNFPLRNLGGKAYWAVDDNDMASLLGKTKESERQALYLAGNICLEGSLLPNDGDNFLDLIRWATEKDIFHDLLGDLLNPLDKQLEEYSNLELIDEIYSLPDLDSNNIKSVVDPTDFWLACNLAVVLEFEHIERLVSDCARYKRLLSIARSILKEHTVNQTEYTDRRFLFAKSKKYSEIESTFSQFESVLKLIRIGKLSGHQKNKIRLNSLLMVIIQDSKIFYPRYYEIAIQMEHRKYKNSSERGWVFKRASRINCSLLKIHIVSMKIKYLCISINNNWSGGVRRKYQSKSISYDRSLWAEANKRLNVALCQLNELRDRIDGTNQPFEGIRLAANFDE